MDSIIIGIVCVLLGYGGLVAYVIVSKREPEPKPDRKVEFHMEMDRFVKNLSMFNAEVDVMEQLEKYKTVEELKKVNERLEEISKTFNL